MIVKVIRILLIFFTLIIIGAFGIVILYDKGEAYCAKRSQKILGDRQYDFVVPTKKEIDELNLQNGTNRSASVSLGYIEFLRCKKEQNLFDIILNKDILKQDVNFLF